LLAGLREKEKLTHEVRHGLELRCGIGFMGRTADSPARGRGKIHNDLEK